MDSIHLRSLVFFVGFVLSGSVFADTASSACQSRHDSGGYASNLVLVGTAVINPDNPLYVHCYFSENGAGRYNVFDVTYTPDPPPPPPPPDCPIGAPKPNITWTIGHRTGSSANSPIAELQTPAQVANQKFCGGTCTYALDTSPGSPSTQVQLAPTPTAKGYYPINATANFAGTGGTCDSNGPDTPAFGQVGTTSAHEPTSPSPGLDKCPNGTISGGIDSGGTPICIGTGTPDTTKSATVSATTSTANADGSTTKVDKVAQTNADGSVTTTTTTTNTAADGSRTVTINNSTGAASNGTAGKSDGGKAGATDPSKADPAKDLCTAHPELNICKNSSVSGACESVACDGDAIQCAQLRTQQKALCEQEKETELGKAAAALSGDSMNGLPTAKNGVVTDIGQSGSSLDSSGFAGSGACFADKTVSIMGKSVTMSFSVVCSYLGYLKYVVLLIAMLGAYKIIGGALLRET